MDHPCVVDFDLTGLELGHVPVYLMSSQMVQMCLRGHVILAEIIPKVHFSSNR